MNFFIYALTRQQSDPLAFLSQPIDPQLEAQVLGLDRNLWCCAVFFAITDKLIVEQNASFVVVERDQVGDRIPIFDFEPIHVTVSDDGVVTEVADGGQPLRRFRVRDRERFAEAMTIITAQMLNRVGSAPDARESLADG